MPIFKIHHRVQYAAIPNDTLRDKRLSIEARGVLAYLLTHTDTFDISFEFLKNELGIGRDKLKSIIRELKKNGYLCLVATHTKKGNFDGQEWFVYAESQNVDFTTHTIDRLTEKPTDGKSDSRKNRQTDFQSDNIKEENKSSKENTHTPRASSPDGDDDSEILDVSARDWKYPLKELFEAFPDVQITSGQAGIIVTDVGETDIEKAAWRSTIKIYKANYNRRRKYYLPEKVGTLLEVFQKQKRNLENENDKSQRKSTGNHRNTRDERDEKAINRKLLVEQARARAEQRRAGKLP